MLQRTHDLGAITLVSFWFLAIPKGPITWETAVGIGMVTLLGSLTPDIDNVASPAWKHKISLWDGSATRHFLEGHRNLSHSLLGVGLFAWVFRLLLIIIALPGINTDFIVQAYGVAMLSHLLLDTLTVQGVPWLFPLPFNFGFPPMSFLRIRTGSWFEKLIIFPALLAVTVAIYYIFRENIPGLLF